MGTIDFGVFVPHEFCSRQSHLRLPEGFKASLSAVEGVEASFRTMTFGMYDWECDFDRALVLERGSPFPSLLLDVRM